MTNEFKTYHPLVNFLYFIAVIGFSCVLMHPACIGISLVCGFSYSVLLKGRAAIRKNLMYMLPMLLVAALLNPAFNHEGVTVLTYLPSGNPLTLESIVYGVMAAGMLVSVLCWFSCYSEVMTSDKFIYLFGKAIPSLSLIFSMTLRFVPRFFAQLKVVVAAQRCIGRDASGGNLVQRAKHGLSILSIMVTWALENAIETADSMKSRGYGLPGRTAFSIFSFDRRDVTALVCLVLLGGYALAGGLTGRMGFQYYPTVAAAEASPFSISVFAAYLALCMLPILLELWEVLKWKAIKSKI